MVVEKKEILMMIQTRIMTTKTTMTITTFSPQSVRVLSNFFKVLKSLFHPSPIVQSSSKKKHTWTIPDVLFVSDFWNQLCHLFLSVRAFTPEWHPVPLCVEKHSVWTENNLQVLLFSRSFRPTVSFDHVTLQQEILKSNRQSSQTYFKKNSKVLQISYLPYK